MKLRLSKGKVHITKPDRKRAIAELKEQSTQSITKLSQKYGITRNWQ